MSGMDRNTGKALDGWAHVEQSIQLLLTTPERSRVMRRAVGCGLPRRVDMPISPTTTIDFYSDAARALADYEPRFKVVRISFDAVPNGGAISLHVEGVYYPRGHLDDFSTSIPKTVRASL